MKKLLLSFIVATLVFFNPIKAISAQTPSAVINPTINPDQSNEEINSLRAEVEALRNENYQNAIKKADDITAKADRLLNWAAGIATIFGIAIATVAFAIGGDWIRLLGSLRGHVESAKRNAQTINEIAGQALKKKVELEKEKKKFVNLLKELGKASTKSQKDMETLQERVQQSLEIVEGKISEIDVLNNSANFISNATAYPSSIPGTAVGTFPFAPEGASLSYFKICASCNLVKDQQEFEKNSVVCNSCKNPIRGV
jgi:ElaB/YqjD/DUF883 family membrane-anchored ribosome-binding protein